MSAKRAIFNGMIQVTQGELLQNVPMSRYTSWRVGGHADRMYIPTGLEDVAAFMTTLAPNEPVHFVGLGSNLLVRDGGIRGTVILMHNALTDMAMVDGALYAEAGVTCSKVAKFSAKQHLHGAEFLAGIPGTVGGALAMNAGCYGAETWDVVSKVMTVNRSGKITTRDRKQFKASYRHVEMPAEEWFLAAWLTLPEGDMTIAEKRIKDLLAKRLASQPLNLPNAGSTFRNPEGDYAARLVEASGLKGYLMGGAQVSEKHANFIVNLGSATAMDIELLIKHMQDTVFEQHGVALQQEVRVIGEYA